MTLADLRAYIQSNIQGGVPGNISGTEVQTALLSLCDQIQSGSSWSPIFGLYPYGPKLLVKITDWTGGQGSKPATGVYMANGGYTTDANSATDVRGTQGAQGLPGSGIVTGSTGPGDSVNVRYYPICELPASGGGTLDFARILVTVKPWDNTTGPESEISLYVSNRGAFAYDWKVRNAYPVDGTSIMGITVADGRTILYLKLNNTFKSWSMRVTDYSQATITASNQYITVLPGGTTVLDTANIVAYPPYMVETSFLPAFNVTNTASANPQTFNAPGRGLLALGGNWKSGPSELDFINTNLYSPASSGFAWFQMLDATTRRELAYLNGSGYMGIGTGAPSSRMHLKGDPTMANNANGISQGGAYQLRLELSYTPVSVSDSAGLPGDFAWDPNYLYVKTTAGWRRMALSAW